MAQRAQGGAPVAPEQNLGQVPTLGDTRKLQQKGAFLAQGVEGNDKFLNLFWTDSSVLSHFKAFLLSAPFFVLTPFRLQHKPRDPDESWHL